MSTDRPAPVTRDTPAWQIAAVAWKGVRGIHTPWIAEVSPMQLGAMNGRTRRAYDERRRAEWDASAEGHAAWRAEVMAAFDAGAFTLDHPELHREARDAVRRALFARSKRAAEAAAEFGADLLTNSVECFGKGACYASARGFSTGAVEHRVV